MYAGYLTHLYLLNLSFLNKCYLHSSSHLETQMSSWILPLESPASNYSRSLVNLPFFVSLISTPSFPSTLPFPLTHRGHLSPVWPYSLPVSWPILQADLSKDSSLSPEMVTHLYTKLHIFWSKMSMWLDSSSGYHWARYLTAMGFTCHLQNWRSSISQMFCRDNGCKAEGTEPVLW